MTSTVRSPSWIRWHGPLAVFAAVMAVLAVVAATGILLDDRYLAGAPVWLKPLKFGVSFLVYAVSLSWVLGRMRRSTPWLTVVGTVFAVSSVIEVGLITLQATRGVESHFSDRVAALDRFVGVGMAVMVVVLWSATLVIALVAARRRFGDDATTAAVRLGLAISVLGAALGALMLVPTAEQQEAVAAGIPTLMGAHGVGAPHGGPGLPVTGWSTTGGDLRVPHFIGIHGLQALPLLAAVLAWRRFGLDERSRTTLVRVGGGTFLGVVVLTVIQALRGQPLLAPDAWTAGGAALLVAGLAAGTARALRPARPR